MSDTLDLLTDKPDWMKNWAHECGKHRGKVGFLVGQPRSGTTLFLRLMHGACLSRMIGERHSEYYDQLLSLRESFFKDVSVGSFISIESNNLFPDMLVSSTKIGANACFSRLLSEALFGTHVGFDPGYAKTTTLGFANENLVPFISMLRETFSYLDLKIVFMSRNHEDIIKSLKTTDGPTKQFYIDNEERIRLFLELQKKQMQEAYDFENDAWITYEKFVDSPSKYLQLIRPMYSPNEAAVKRIMARKIRSSNHGFDANELVLGKPHTNDSISLHQTIYSNPDRSFNEAF